MQVFVFRGLPGSPAMRVARQLLYRPVDHIIDLTEFWETDQGNLFITESPPEEAQEAAQELMRSPEISRLGICGMINKGWVEEIIERIDVETVEVYWLVVENARKPEGVSKRFYDRLESNFEIDVYK